MLLLIGGSILGLEIKGDLGGRDKPHPRPVSLPACASLPPHLSLPVPSHPTHAPNIVFSRRLCCKNVRHRTQLTSRAQTAVSRSQRMEGRRRERGLFCPQLFLHGGAVHGQGSGWMRSCCRGAVSAEPPHSPTAPGPHSPRAPQPRAGQPLLRTDRKGGRPDPFPSAPTFWG